MNKLTEKYLEEWRAFKVRCGLDTPQKAMNYLLNFYHNREGHDGDSENCSLCDNYFVERKIMK